MYGFIYHQYLHPPGHHIFSNLLFSITTSNRGKGTADMSGMGIRNWKTRKCLGKPTTILEAMEI